MNDNNKRWNGKSRGGSFGYSFFIYCIKFVGIRVSYAFMSLIIFYFIIFAPKATAASWQYSRRILKKSFFRSLGHVYMHFFNFGKVLLDKLALNAGMTDKYALEFEHYQRFLSLINSGVGVVLIGAHIGNWQAGSAFFGKYGKKIHIVMFDAEHEKIKAHLEKNSVDKNFNIISTNGDTIDALIQMKVALNNGEYVCFNGDRFIDSSSVIEKEFIGGKVSLPKGPFLIAQKCRVPVVFYFAVRDKKMSYKFYFFEFKSNKAYNYSDIADNYLSVLELMVQKYPYQWFNFFKYWNFK